MSDDDFVRAQDEALTRFGVKADFLEGVLDALGLEQPALVGNSLGSLWSFWLASERPGRVAAMVHVGCPALLLGTAAPLPMRLLSVPLLGGLLMALQPPSPAQVEQLARTVGEHPLPPEIAVLLLATEKRPGFDERLRAWLHALLRLTGPRSEIALDETQLASIRQAVLLVWGAGDPFAPPPVAERASRILPACELHVVEGGPPPGCGRPRRSVR